MISVEHKRQLILHSGLSFDPDLCQDKLLHEIFEAIADRFSDKIAVEMPLASLT